MQFRKVGDYQHKGDVGIYLEAVDLPHDTARYCAASWSLLPDELFRAIDRKEVVELDLDTPLYHRIDQCL